MAAPTRKKGQTARSNIHSNLISYNIRDILKKKRDGEELHWEELEYFVKGLIKGTIKDAQTGALLMACHIQGISDTEIDLFMRAMMFSGRLLTWPKEWHDILASLQSTGSTGNKAKLILAPVMAACGLKFPILSRSGSAALLGILSKLSTIPGFNGTGKTMEDVCSLLSEVGCCVVEQPVEMAPAERIVRDMAELVSVGNNNAFKEACMVARVGAMRLATILMDIPYGPGESIKTKSAAVEMATTMAELSKIMSVKCNIVITNVDHPVGQNIGHAVEIVEAIKCLHGHAPDDLHKVVCKLGAYILQASGVVGSLAAGEHMIDKKLKDGSAKKKFGQMLQAQGVDKSVVKNLLKTHANYDHLWHTLPAAHLFTYLTVDESGFVHGIDVAVCYDTMFELLSADDGVAAHAGGMELMTSVGAYLNRGEVWAKIHHHSKLNDEQLTRLKNAISLKIEPPLTDMVIEIQEITV